MTAKCPGCGKQVRYYIDNEEVSESLMTGTDRLCTNCYDKWALKQRSMNKK